MPVEQLIKSTQLNGQKKLRLFLKGSDDLVHSLLRPQADGPEPAAFLQEWANEKNGNVLTIQITHEPSWRSDLLLQQLNGMTLPHELSQQGLDSDYITAQFNSRLLGEPADVVVLSLQPEIEQELWRNKETGCLLHPPSDWEQQWSSVQRSWFQEHFAPTGRFSVGEFRQNYAELVHRIQEEMKAHVVVFGCSSYDPADLSHNYRQDHETLVLRTHRFNFAMIELSQSSGLFLVDVDRLLAEMGGQSHVRRIFRYSAEAYQAAGREFLHLLDSLSLFEDKGLLRLVMPKLDQQFEAGSIVRWHKQEGDWVKAGDDLFDFKVEEIKRFKRVNARNPEKIKNVEENTRNWSWLVRVTASDEGYLRKTYVAEKETCVAEDLLAVLSVEADTPLVLDEKAVVQGDSFQVVGNILENHQSFD
jgi:hypothetical protein